MVIIFIYSVTKKKQKNMDNFLNEFINWLKRKEGGLSNDMRDTASKYPSPTPEKYHTNIGVTYKTFIDSASTLNYNPSVKNFLEMPNDIWFKIFSEKYYNKTKNLTDNEVLNAYMSLWYWGGWSNSLMPTSSVTAVLTSKKTGKEKLFDLVELRKKYFENIVKNNPTQKVYLNGWKNAANDFYKNFSDYA